MTRHRRYIAALAPETYDALLAVQGGGCAICGAKPKTRRLHRDHDHKTMELRGLLCHRCNRGLPTWADDFWLGRARWYVNHPPAARLA